jgi:uncharacterized protein (TIGR02266 family)
MSSGRHRRDVRRALDAEFRLRDADDVVGGEILFDAVDISEGGAFLRSQYLLEVGERIEVSFTLPGQSQLIHVRALVAWVTRSKDLKGEAGMGLEFVDLDAEEREVIAAFVRGQLQLGMHKP